jgi:hypothetical protein
MLFEKGLDIQIKNPRVTPATLPRHAYSFERRLAGSISIRVAVELRLHQRLQVPLDHHLSDAVGNSRNGGFILHLLQ